ncbi:ROK family protein [Oscillospiraceae bacterium PP1C4]
MKVGIDLGGTKIAAAILNSQNEIILKQSILTNHKEGAENVIRRMSQLVIDLAQNAGINACDIEHIGIGSPGTIDSSNGVVLYSNNIEWNHVNLRGLMQTYINVPVYIENDANCAALGEYIAGAGKQYSSMVMVTLGTGIGGGIILGNKLYRGRYNTEIGHTAIISNGELCTCGRKGCWEAYGSVTAFIRLANQMADEFPDSALFKARKEDGELNGKNIFSAVKSGDKTAKALFEQYIFYVAEGITNLVNVLDPEAIVIGGGISKEGAFLIDPIREFVKRNIFCKCIPIPVITTSELGNDAGIIGAACLNEY